MNSRKKQSSLILFLDISATQLLMFMLHTLSYSPFLYTPAYNICLSIQAVGSPKSSMIY